MSKNPKIVVFKLKELIYTGIFILLGILLIILLVWMFKSGKSKDTPASNTPVNTLSTSSGDSTGTVSDNSDINAANKTTNNESTGNSSANEGTTDNSSTDEGTTGNSSTNEGTSDNSSTSEGTTGSSSTDEGTTNPPSTSGTEKQTQKNTSGKKYSPGVYTTALMLNNSALEIEVCVNSDKITSVSIKNMDTGIKTMYPLIENSMKDLEYQIVSSQSLENITYTDDCKYTYLILIDGVSQALSKAELK